MSELNKVLLTSGLTVVSGTLIYVLGNILVRLFLEPVVELRKVIGETGDALIYFANVYTSPIKEGGQASDKQLECMKTLRQAATRLMGKAYGAPCLWAFAIFSIVPWRAKIREAHSALIGLSNMVGDRDTRAVNQKRQEVERALGLFQEESAKS